MTLAALKRKAKSAGVPVSDIRKAKTADEVQTLIDNRNGTGSKPAARKAVKKATTRKAVVKKASKRAPAVKSTAGKAKRPATKPAAKTPTRSSTKSGRHIIEGVDFTATKNWNARVGSAPDRIMTALRKSKGDREKAFDTLQADVWDFVGKVKRNGEKRTKAEAHAMLRYRIARTLWDFVTKTGQHKKSTNRIEYGTGPNAQPKPKRGRPAKKAAVTAPKRRGRPPGVKSKVPAKRGPGRPRGTKNKR